MKKQDNESLIQELTKRLDWYIMKASDEEFDADEVQTLMKLLDNLKTEEDNVEDELPVEEALDDFWKHCEEREEEERLLLGTEEEKDKSEPVAEKEEDKPREGKLHKVLWYFRRRRFAVVVAAVLVVMVLGGSWQVVANAEKHGGFFWWMDKNEEGTTMITAPEGVEDSDSSRIEIYDNIEKIPEDCRKYVEQTCEISAASQYNFSYAKIVRGTHNDTIYVFLKNNSEILRFEIKMYPQKILRVRETYPGFTFEKEFDNEGIVFDVFSKKETLGQVAYLMYFYYDREKYVVVGRVDENTLREIVIEYKNTIVNKLSARQGVEVQYDKTLEAKAKIIADEIESTPSSMLAGKSDEQQLYVFMLQMAAGEEKVTFDAGQSDGASFHATLDESVDGIISIKNAFFGSAAEIEKIGIVSVKFGSRSGFVYVYEIY